DVESGLHVDRAQYQQALALARAKGFDQLVVWRYDRSGRDDAEYMGMLRDFAKLGITLVSASGESPDPLYQKLAGVLAWDESRRVSIRVSGSKMKRHTEGKWNGKPVFGYSIHQLRDDPRNCEVCRQHSPGGCILVPNEQAPLVTEMFQRYASGKHSLMDLRRFLNQFGVLKGRSGILYILTNRTYLGLAPHGRNVRSQFHPAPDQMDWSQGQHQPLTDYETFDRVQARLTDNRHRQRGGTSPCYLFSGMIYCGICGGKYGGRHGDKSYNWYTCNRRIGFGDCQSHTIYESSIRDQVIPPIEKLLGKLNREDVRASVRAELVRQEEDAKSADVVTKLGAKETLERLEARLSNLEDAYLDGDIAKDRYRARR
ncbi:MAG TPA: recombinase zinc beta ribbon domain-containing protein, partial [Dehalococcoidia bacterium]|nr:recombinase zinc beta ribbon domain-containing protein [Dehalococcoidia bacterium]